MPLYHLYEWQRAAFAPIRLLLDHGQYFFRNPLNPMAYTPQGRILAAAFDVMEHSTRPYGKPRFDIDHTVIGGRKVAIEEDILVRKPFGQLKRFKRLVKTKDPKLLIVAPMSGHFATLLRGTVRAMVPDHDVYITDWRDAKTVPLREGRFDLDDYIDYVIEFIEFLGEDLHVMAVCQPAVPVSAAVARMAAMDHPLVPRTLTMMGGPIDTRINPTQVNEFATNRPLAWFKHNVISAVPAPHAGFMRRVYPGFLQLAGFMAMNLGDHLVRHHDMFRHLVEGDGESASASQAFYEEYRSVMDVTEEFYLATVDKVFQRHLLPQGELTHRDEPVDLGRIRRTAVFTIEGERDDISSLGQTKAVHALLTGLPDDMKAHHEQKNVGHYGIFNGRRWREQIAPRIKAFIRQHAKQRRAISPAA
ncbi:MAG: polyhydroxyalkanoate depolymerase [Alphaproteobacteria bacterium]|nr:MAG: polyhydroxyalkanoate depolymerase [Alphaproteobacteria bacterium]